MEEIGEAEKIGYTGSFSLDTHSMEELKKYGINCLELENGTKIIFKKMPIETVCARLMVDCGSIYEPPRYLGLSHFLEHLIGKDGLIKDKRKRIQYKLERAGCDLDYAYTSQGRTTFGLVSPFNSWSRNLTLYLDMIANPQFSDKDCSEEMKVIGTEIKDDNCGVYDDMLKRIFPRRHPLFAPPYGTRETISRIRSEKLRKWHSLFYQPQRICLIVVGDLDPKSIERAVRKSKLFGLQNKEDTIPKISCIPMKWGGNYDVEGLISCKLKILFKIPPSTGQLDCYYFKLILDIFEDVSCLSDIWIMIRHLGIYCGPRTDQEFVHPFGGFVALDFDVSSLELLRQVENKFIRWMKKTAENGFNRDTFLHLKNSMMMRVADSIRERDWWIELLSNAVYEQFFPLLDSYLLPEKMNRTELNRVFRQYFATGYMIFRGRT